MSYNLGIYNITNTATMLDVVEGVNNSSGNLFGMLLLTTIFITFYLIFKKEENLLDVIISSFLTSIFAILMFLIGLIAWYMIMIPISVLIIAIIIYFYE